MTSLSRILAAPVLALGLSLGAAPAALAADGAAIETSVTEAELPAKKVSKTGLYVTAAEAIEVLAARDDVALVDVRSPAETMLVGYATATDVNIPLKTIDPAHPYNAKKGRYGMRANPGFVGAVKAFVAREDPAALLVICRSGARAAKAVNALVAGGVEVPAYSVVDGFEGDTSDAGKRTVNGWKNAGGEWTYKVRPGLWPRADG